MAIEISKKIIQLQFRRKQQRIFLENLSSLIEDGVSVSQAVDTIAQIYDGITKKVAEDILQGIAAGKLLSDCLANWFPYSVVEMIRAGEMGGSLKQSIKTITQSLAESSHVIAILIKTLTYPIIVFVLALIVMVFVKNSTLVTFSEIKPVTTWPSVSRMLFQFAECAQQWWWLWLFIFISFFLMIRHMLCFLTGNFRQIIDQIPILSLYREVIAARFMETLGLLMANGVMLNQALKAMYQEASPYLAWHILHMEYRLSAGHDSIAEVLNTRLINKSDMIRLKIIAKGKGIEHALSSLGRKANQHNCQRIEVMSRVFAALLLLGCAALAMMIVLGIYQIGSLIAT